MKLEAYKQIGLQLLKCELNVGGLIGSMNNEHDILGKGSNNQNGNLRWFSP